MYVAEAVSSGSAGASFGGALPGTLAARFFQAKQLLAESGVWVSKQKIFRLLLTYLFCVENAKSPEVYKQRYEAMRALLDQAKDIAATLHPKDHEEVLKLVSELDALNEELRRLEDRGEVSVD